MSTSIAAASTLTQERLKQVLSYDSDTGDFIWLVSHENVKAGEFAGGMSKGYRRIMADGRFYLAHRLAWFYMRGKWPDGQIDHINGIRSDNRLSNLRDVSHSVNQQNRRAPNRSNATGFLGVNLHSDGKFQARIKVNKRTVHLGLFVTPEEAHAAYVAAKREHHEGCSI